MSLAAWRREIVRLDRRRLRAIRRGDALPPATALRPAWDRTSVQLGNLFIASPVFSELPALSAVEAAKADAGTVSDVGSIPCAGSPVGAATSSINRAVVRPEQRLAGPPSVEAPAPPATPTTRNALCRQ
jgi:hypothetical protein